MTAAWPFLLLLYLLPNGPPGYNKLAASLLYSRGAPSQRRRTYMHIELPACHLPPLVRCRCIAPSLSIERNELISQTAAYLSVCLTMIYSGEIGLVVEELPAYGCGCLRACCC
jgi:hypothetical protein